MAATYKRLVRHVTTLEEQLELRFVDDLAVRLLAHLDEVSDQIDRVHVHNARSSEVQEIVALLLRERLGFAEEWLIPPEDGFTTRARPDFHYSLGARRGILAEVERGGTVNNNHDLKDMWKAHIALDAHHLFLIVPNANWKEAGTARERPFPRVARRLGAFFGDDRREIDVLSVHLFGYGATSPHRSALGGTDEI